MQKIIHVERVKPLTNGNYIKECLMEAVNDLCPKNSNLFASTSLSASSVVRRTKEFGENIVVVRATRWRSG